MSEDETIISVVAPCYNDEGNVAELVRRLNAVANEMQVSIEIIVVDDRSPDNAWEVINQLSGEYENFRGYRLSRNFGQHIAITAGIQQSKGAYIVIMDGDLQDRPEEIPNLYSKIQEGYDLVFTVRKDRKDAPSRRLSSRIYRSVINKLSGLDTPTNIAMMRIFTRELVRPTSDSVKSNAPLARCFRGWGTGKPASKSNTRSASADVRTSTRGN